MNAAAPDAAALGAGAPSASRSRSPIPAAASSHSWASGSSSHSPKAHHESPAPTAPQDSASRSPARSWKHTEAASGSPRAAKGRTCGSGYLPRETSKRRRDQGPPRAMSTLVRWSFPELTEAPTLGLHVRAGRHRPPSSQVLTEANTRCGAPVRTRPALLLARDFSDRGMQRPRADRWLLVQLVAVGKAGAHARFSFSTAS